MCLSKEAQGCCSQTKSWYAAKQDFIKGTLLGQVEERNTKLNDLIVFQNFTNTMVKLSADMWRK